MTARQLASAWGVTTATIRNYEKEGMSSSGVDADGVKVWEKAAAEKWRAENRPPGSDGHGGRRERAGRGAGGAVARSEAPPAAVPGAAVPGADVPGAVGVGGEALLPDLGGVKLDTPEEIFAAFRTGKLPAQKAKGLRDATLAARARIDLDLKESKLWDAAASLAAWGRHLQSVRRRFEAIARTATPRVLLAVGAGPELGAAVREVLRTEVETVLAELARDPMGEDEGSQGEAHPSAPSQGEGEKK